MTQAVPPSAEAIPAVCAGLFTCKSCKRERREYLSCARVRKFAGPAFSLAKVVCIDYNETAINRKREIRMRVRRAGAGSAADLIKAFAGCVGDAWRKTKISYYRELFCMNRLVYRIKRYYKKKMIPLFRKELGIDELQDNIYTLLNSATDITKCLPATGELREVQLVGAKLLTLIDFICRKENLTYWLDWGTLLGSIRHNGFVPWDDDLDICMPREDYTRAIGVFGDYFSGRAGCDLQTREMAEKSWMWINFWDAGIHVDIFPVDSVCVPAQMPEEEVLKIVAESRRQGYSEKIAAKEDPISSRRVFYYPTGIWSHNRFFEEDVIFPLREHEFEEYSFYVPNRFGDYLKTEYGDYMKYPYSRILKHRDVTAESSARAAVSTELDGMIKDLKEASENN